MAWFGKHRIIYFIHVYKTAGTAVNDFLYQQYKKDEIVNLYVPFLETGPDGAFFRAGDQLTLTKATKMVFGHFPYGVHLKYPDHPYRYICFLRDPFDRLVSTYYHHARLGAEERGRILEKLDPEGRWSGSGGDSFPGLEEFLRFPAVHNHQCMFLTGVPATKIMKDQEYYARLAMDHIEKEFAFVGLQEALEESKLQLQKMLRFKPGTVPHLNKGINKPATIPDEQNLRTWVKEQSRADTLIYEFVRKRFYSHSVI